MERERERDIFQCGFTYWEWGLKTCTHRREGGIDTVDREREMRGGRGSLKGHIHNVQLAMHDLCRFKRETKMYRLSTFPFAICTLTSVTNTCECITHTNRLREGVLAGYMVVDHVLSYDNVRHSVAIVCHLEQR